MTMQLRRRTFLGAVAIALAAGVALGAFSATRAELGRPLSCRKGPRVRSPDPSGPDAAPGRHVRLDRGRHQAGRDQHQHRVQDGGATGPDAVRGVLRRGVLPSVLRRGARADPAAEPRLRGHRRSDRHRAHERPRGGQGHGDRGRDPRRRQAPGEGHRRGQEDRPRRAQARRREGRVQVRAPGRFGPGSGWRLGPGCRLSVRSPGDGHRRHHQRQSSAARPGARSTIFSRPTPPSIQATPVGRW